MNLPISKACFVAVERSVRSDVAVPSPDELFDDVLRFRVAVLVAGHRGPPHPSPLPEERVPGRRPLFPSIVQGRITAH